MDQKKKRKSLTAFSILLIVLAVVCLVSVALQGNVIDPEIIKPLDPGRFGELIDAVDAGEDITVQGATFSNFIMAIPEGFIDAADLVVFIVALGGFIGVVMKTGALEAGVYHLVKKLKGKEERLIVVLMFLFSLGGTTYGMAEETIGFYALITSAMVAAGFDTIVAVGTVLLGAGAGVLGSTINPFATGAAMGALSSVGIEPNTTLIMVLGLVLWLSTFAICCSFVLSYAKKVKKDKGSTILSLQEQQVMKESFTNEDGVNLEFTSKHKRVLLVFAFAFVIMIASLISYQDLAFGGDEEAYLSALGWSDFLTGQPLGWWYFTELAGWFILASIGIGIMAKLSEKEFVDTFIAGSADLLSVGLIIAVARGITVVMGKTHLDFYILDHSSKLLSGVPGFIFTPAAYVIYLFLSFLVPSTSGLAALSIPVMGSLTGALGFNPSVMIMVFCGGSGLINLFTPTSGVVMGGLGAAKVEYSTYMKWVFKLLVAVGIANVIVLTAAMMML
ncbi:YfcC family protein [Peptoniphilus mikwangii]|uniref:YfcC family protein n=1 Tax=Peptoniphilus mikwangii TaxID=1354300 RepID=UPI00041B6A5E|nr:YfcC family protein [Peptoniphilus mikwangii]